MKSLLENLLSEALQALPELSEVVGDLSLLSTIERTRDAAHGDFASNIAMRLAKPARRSPRDLAAAIVEQLPDTQQLAKGRDRGAWFHQFLPES